ncbi:MAG: winged helix-turn-helix transcriptional regulator, partial [Candidatus Poribacteria bacterium]|nr:winged helix-turn-helix transcriptional regulator [Candidatus Poribacteria bacterium]
LTSWLEYFTAGIAVEMQRVKELVLTHSRDRALRDKIGQVALSERQLAILAYVEKNSQITNRELQQLANLSHAAAHKELVTLVESGVLVKKGKARGTHYVLVDDF